MTLTTEQLKLITNHENCSSENLEIKGNMFCARGIWASGIVCKKCNALWINAEDNFFEKLKEITKDVE